MVLEKEILVFGRRVALHPGSAALPELQWRPFKKYDKDDSNKRISNDNFSKSSLTPESNHRNISGGEEQDDVDCTEGCLMMNRPKFSTSKSSLKIHIRVKMMWSSCFKTWVIWISRFKLSKETDIGRHVNQLRKHPSNEVRLLVKQLVRLLWSNGLG